MAGWGALAEANPGLVVVAGLVFGGALVFTLIGLLMARAGSSLRGLAVVAGLYALVVLPQAVGQWALAVKPAAAAAAAPVPPETNAEDLRPLFARQFAGLVVAEGRRWPQGEALARLRFVDEAAAAAGLLRYLQLYQVAPRLDRGGVEIRGERGLGGGLVHLRRDGAELKVMTALDEAGLARLLAPSQAAHAPATTEPLLPALQPLVQAFQASWVLQAAGLLVAVAVYAAAFLGAVAWAGRVPAPSGVAPQPAEVLAQRLQALQAAPLQVEALPDSRLVLSWQHGGACWLDAAGLHRQRQQHRLLLRLHAASRSVRVLEQWRAFEADAGPAGARLRWHTARGLRFFQREQQTLLGLQLGADGRPTGEWLRRLRFDLAELKAPAMQVVAAAGWRWQPVWFDRGAA